MKKFSVLALTFVLIAALFAGCRRNPDTTGSTPVATTTTAASTTKPTTKPATKPAETTRPDGTGVLPSATDMLPDMTNGTDVSRAHRGPRY